MEVGGQVGSDGEVGGLVGSDGEVGGLVGSDWEVGGLVGSDGEVGGLVGRGTQSLLTLQELPTALLHSHTPILVLTVHIKAQTY